MQRLYLSLAAVGYLAAGVPMLMESVQSGNILFWTDPRRTATELFANLTAGTLPLFLYFRERRLRPRRDPVST